MALYELDGLAVKTPGPGRFWVAGNAVVIGNVEIGDDVSIWFNSVVRGDNDAIKIGAGSNIQDGCVLHVDPGFPMDIGANCTVGHKVLLHGCTIGAGSLIGMGSIIMNGVQIGEQCLIGANTLIPEGKVIPPRTMVFGAPGKLIRELTEAEIEKIAITAGNYQRNWRKFAVGLCPQTENLC